jgi:cellulose synthase/poly-beta-1,6-N-acetylglucosamine synthase-like glycosyltransferase
MNRRIPALKLAISLSIERSSLTLPMPCLGVVMPVFNEAATVAEILRRVLAQPCVQEVVAVDDGSTDETSAILGEWLAKDPRVQVVSHAVNRGKGAASRDGGPMPKRSMRLATKSHSRDIVQIPEN